MIYKNLQIIGSSHISKESISQVKKQVKEYKPEIIALELDRIRLNSLFSKEKKSISIKSIQSIGFSGFIFGSLASYIEHKIGKMVKVSPGSEMKTAAILAKENSIPIYLIDQDVRITLKKLSNKITVREKFNFIADIFKSLFVKTSNVNIDISKVPSQKEIDFLLKEVKKRYPSIYYVLIKERNSIMAKSLYKLMANNKDKKILAIMGAGHKEETLNLIKNEFSKSKERGIS